jgi:hypothetical protein
MNLRRSLLSLVDPPALWLSEHDLISAILMSALDDLRGVGPATAESGRPGSRRNLKRRARRWLFSQRKTAGSFLWCCDLLSLDPEAVRRPFHLTVYTGGSKTGGLVQVVKNPLVDEKFQRQKKTGT